MMGMRKRYIVNLSDEERSALTKIAGRDRVSAFKRQRAQILLLADDGLADEEIANETGAAVRTVERVRQRCCERGVTASLERKPQEQPSRRRKLDGTAEAQLVRLACSEPPEGRSRWTLTLLGDGLVALDIVESVSKTTIHRVLKKTNSSRGA
jgi:uncharacterized protein YerC